MEEALEDLRHEEALQKSTHTELLTEIQQLSCDNHMWYCFINIMSLITHRQSKSFFIFFYSRTNISTIEDRFNRLRKEMDIMRDERTRLTVALEFSKEEKNHLDKQNKELKEKAG